MEEGHGWIDDQQEGKSDGIALGRSGYRIVKSNWREKNVAVVRFVSLPEPLPPCLAVDWQTWLGREALGETGRQI